MSTLPSIGDLFAGSYRIEGVLGRGGHGAVFAATNLMRGNRVALKVLLPEQLDSEGLDRFRREAELAQRLTNEHSVRLFEHGEQEHGLPFIAFELLKGQPLSHLLEQRGPQSYEVVARVARAVLEALTEAHALGIVHRDIKPANVFLCQYEGAADFVKVLDFGIAKRHAKDATQLTAMDVVVGTARYMAPEQLRGAQIAPATDLYSLGLVMAEMLTGAPIFRGSTIEVCMEQVSADPVPLPDAVRASPLGRVIERATDKDLSRRYPSARAMLADLPSATPRTLIEGTPNLAAPVPTSSPALPARVSHPGYSVPPYSAVPTSSPVLSTRVSWPGQSAHPSLPPSAPLPVARPRSSGALWALGLFTAFLLLAALIAAGALLVTSRGTPEEPPPMPSAR